MCQRSLFPLYRMVKKPVGSCIYREKRVIDRTVDACADDFKSQPTVLPESLRSRSDKAWIENMEVWPVGALLLVYPTVSMRNIK